MNYIRRLYAICRKSNSNFWIVALKAFYYKTRGKNIIAHQRAIINGVKNISTKGTLKIGVEYVGFTHHMDITYLNIMGSVEVSGSFSIGRGCRFDIGKDALVKLGHDSYIHPFTNAIIMNGLEIGQGCSISWYCRFLDEDFHQLEYEGKAKEKNKSIIIGNNVWVGANVSIYKGAVIPNGCVIASDSIVKSKFDEENVLIAGNPARIIKRNIRWH